MLGLPTGTVTFLFTDIEGSTELLQRLGDRRYAEVLAEHRRILRGAIQEHSGQEVDSQGDALFAVFPSAQEAMTAAVAAQRTLKAHPWPPDASVQVRMGLHTGEARLETGYVGIDVHQAARICAAGHGGQILLSDTTRRLVTESPEVNFRDLGKHRLKDLPNVERLFQVIAAALPAEFPPLKSLDALPDSLPRQLIRLIGRPEVKIRGPSTRPLGRRRWLWAVALVVIAATTVGIWRVGLVPRAQRARPTAGAAPRLSIVVLPFASLGKETDRGFTDAIVQDLTTVLSRISGSFVIAWSTAAIYKGRAVDPQQIGRDLGVRYVLEGSVQRSANRVRVNAQLIDAETNSHLWAERFDRELGNLFAVQDEITERIANTLGLQLTRIEAERAERNRTNPEAMDYVLRGRALWQRPPSKDKYRQQQELFERALQLDDRLPAAQIQLSLTLSGKVLDLCYPCDAPEAEANLRRAEDLISKVLAVDPNNPDAHFAKAQILRAQASILGMQDRFAQAIGEYETAIALDPNSPAALRHLAQAKIFVGEPAEAIPLLEQSLRISPHDPLIGFNYHRLGIAHLLLGHLDEAIQWYEKAIPSFPFLDKADAYVGLGAALSLKGDRVAAQAALAEAARHNPKYTTIANIRRLAGSFSKDPKYLALQERTIIEGLRKAGVPEE
jgi:TolB-like protein/class 3 adenylate cyclase/Tfp pilus assembly protein PilF